MSGKIVQFPTSPKSSPTAPKTLGELIVRLKNCSEPNQLQGLIWTLDPDAAIVVQKLFDKAFEAGLKRDRRK